MPIEGNPEEWKKYYGNQPKKNHRVKWSVIILGILIVIVAAIMVFDLLEKNITKESNQNSNLSQTPIERITTGPTPTPTLNLA